jgi:protein-arginine kinase activator protein McsA
MRYRYHNGQYGYLTVRRVVFDTFMIERCPKCNKGYIVDPQYETYQRNDRPGCSRCDYFGKQVRALRRRKTWFNHVGKQQEPVKFPAAISKILYGP